MNYLCLCQVPATTKDLQRPRSTVEALCQVILVNRLYVVSPMKSKFYNRRITCRVRVSRCSRRMRRRRGRHVLRCRRRTSHRRGGPRSRRRKRSRRPAATPRWNSSMRTATTTDHPQELRGPVTKPREHRELLVLSQLYPRLEPLYMRFGLVVYSLYKVSLRCK